MTGLNKNDHMVRISSRFHPLRTVFRNGRDPKNIPVKCIFTPNCKSRIVLSLVFNTAFPRKLAQNMKNLARSGSWKTRSRTTVFRNSDFQYLGGKNKDTVKRKATVRSGLLLLI